MRRHHIALLETDAQEGILPGKPHPRGNTQINGDNGDNGVIWPSSELINTVTVWLFWESEKLGNEQAASYNTAFLYLCPST